MSPSQIRALIGQDQLQDAVQAVLDWSAAHGDQFQDEAILYSSQLRSLENDERMGVIAHEQARINRNQIRSGLLHLVKLIHEVETAPRRPEPEANTNNRGEGHAAAASGLVKVFPSYAPEDAPFVRQLQAELKRAGVDVWTNREDMTAGESWRTQIIEGIKSSDALMVVLSPHSAGSRIVVRELTLADEYRKKIVPVLYRPCQIPEEAQFQLAGIHLVDFTIQPFPEALAQLHEAFGQAPGKSMPNPQLHYQQAQPTRKTLVGILPGNWQVQLNVQTFWGPRMGTMSMSMGSNYTFQGGNQMFRVQGQWSLPQFNQLVLSGMQTNGFAQMPYYTTIQFTQITERHLQGITSGNEMANWQRVG